MAKIDRLCGKKWWLPGGAINTKIEEVSALGAAMLAAISLGIYKDLDDASRNMVKIVECHTPNPEVHRKYEDMFQMYKELYGALRKFYGE